jgi:hypothetical protein
MRLLDREGQPIDIDSGDVPSHPISDELLAGTVIPYRGFVIAAQPNGREFLRAIMVRPDAACPIWRQFGPDVIEASLACLISRSFGESATVAGSTEPGRHEPVARFHAAVWNGGLRAACAAIDSWLAEHPVVAGLLLDRKSA